jgi:hypothetical protein
MVQYSDTVITEISNIARTFLRDFPKFFQTSFEATTRTYELGHPNIDASSLYIASYTSNTPTVLDTSAFSLDVRNGILRLVSTPAANSSLMVEGYYYEWVHPTDLKFYTKHAINEHVYNLSTPLENMSKIVIDTIGIAAVVHSLWALLSEYSRDIDVMTSESVHIPGSQRFRMVQSLLEYWQASYEKNARSLNIGVNRIEVMNLSRISRITNRYIPMYRGRELGDYGPIERVFPERDTGTIEVEDKGDDLREEVFVDTNPPSSLYTTGQF